MAPAPRGSSGVAIALWLGLGFCLVLFLLAGVGFWLWQRSQVTARVLPSPTPFARPTPVVDEGAPATPNPLPTVSPSSAVPVGGVVPVPQSPTPRPIRPTAAPTTASTPTSSGGVATPAPVVTTPPPVAPTSAPTPPPPAAPPGQAFRLGGRIDLSDQVGPIRLTAATFKNSRPTELESQLEFFCNKGKDQKVSYEVTLMNAAGATVLAFKGQQGVEEGDKGTAKRKDPVAVGLLDTVRYFRVSFSSVND
jgi:hypothetical protein